MTGSRNARARSSSAAGRRDPPAQSDSTPASSDSSGRAVAGALATTSGSRPNGEPPVPIPRSPISLLAPAGPIPSTSRSSRNQLTSSWGFSRMRSTVTASFTCAASMNLRPPYLTNGMLRAASSSSRRSLWGPQPKQHGLTPKEGSPLPVLQQRPAHGVRLGRLVETGHQGGPGTVGPGGPEGLLV